MHEEHLFHVYTEVFVPMRELTVTDAIEQRTCLEMPAIQYLKERQNGDL